MKQAEEIAREAVSTYLASRPPIPAVVRENLILGEGRDGDDWLFELYVPGIRPEHAVVLVEARVDMRDGEVSVTSPVGDRWDSVPLP
ncbi:MAG: hypothetical protein ABMA64_25570 [Myxococcota bacterium]